MILRTSLSKSLFFKTTLNCSYILLLDIFSITMKWGFCKYALSKNIKTNIFKKSAFANRKLIVIIYSRNLQRILQTWNWNNKNNLIFLSAITLLLSLSSKRPPTSTSLLTHNLWFFADMILFHQAAEFHRFFPSLPNIINLFDISFHDKSIFLYH